VTLSERPGAALDRNLGSPTAPGETADKELDQFISRRHERRVLEEGERAEEEAWRESARRAEAARREENRAAWCAHHADQAERLRASLAELVAYHEREAEKHLAQKGS
jgi:hypothetical protein